MLSRRRLLKAGGSLVIAFALPRCSSAAQAPLPQSLQVAPRLDAWIQIGADSAVTLFTGKVEIGQGIKTALVQIAADELDVDLARIQIVCADTARTPNEFYTAGSNSIEESGAAIRQAAADARLLLLELAALRLEVPLQELTVKNAIVHARGRSTGMSYGELLDGRTLARNADGRGTCKNTRELRVVGTSVGRIDLPDKVFGRAAFIHDIRLPGMLHGRIVRPPSLGATLLSLDHSAIEREPGVVRVIRDGNFIGVVTEREEHAVRAARALSEGARWSERPMREPPERFYEWLMHAKSIDKLIVNGKQVDDPIPPRLVPEPSTQRLSAVYRKPLLMHGSIGPSLAIAQFSDEALTVWTHTQGPFPVRGSLANALGMRAEMVRCIHAEGAGCYGHNGSDDVALDAALLARAVPGRPVRVQWMRSDEHLWEPYGPAMVVALEASLDREGRIQTWNTDLYTLPHATRALGQAGPASELLAAWHRTESKALWPLQPFPGLHGGEHRNADPLYTFAERRIVKHFVAAQPVRTSSLRGLGAYANVFAIESFMDELASDAGADPVEYRLRHLADARAQQVIRLAAQKAGWASSARLGSGRGRGIGFAQYKNKQGYAAVIVEVQVERASGEVRLERAVIAADAGLVVNPDGLVNQLEGGVVQSSSWTLKEEVRFDPVRLNSRDWASYPILTLAEAPRLETHLINRADSPSIGAGEITQGPTAAAIANAVFHAIGIRLRQTPFTPERVLAALRDTAPPA